jgi:glycosyltransferase involved in cell wall biosynthesis
MEAMALGMAVIATDVGGTADLVINNLTGILVGKGSKEQIQKALIEMLTSDDLRKSVGAAGRELIYKKHDIQMNVRGLEKIYEKLIDI